MRYTKFVIDHTISRVTKNPVLRATVKTTGGGIYTILKGMFGILFSPIGAMIAAGVIGIYMFSTLYGTLTDVMSSSFVSANMNTTTSSVFASSFNMLSSTTGMFPLVVVAIGGIIPILFITRMLGSDMFRGGAM